MIDGKQLGELLAERVVDYVGRALTPIKNKQESSDQLIADLAARIEALEGERNLLAGRLEQHTMALASVWKTLRETEGEKQ